MRNNTIGLLYVAEDDKLYLYKSYKDMKEFERSIKEDKKFENIKKKSIRVVMLSNKQEEI